MNNPRPGGSIRPPHLAPDQLAQLTEKVAQQYGAFGTRPDEEEMDRKVLADNYLKPTLQLIGGIFVA